MKPQIINTDEIVLDIIENLPQHFEHDGVYALKKHN